MNTETPEKNANSAENVGEVPNSPVMIHKQYLKDMSFENPNAPGILMEVEGRPNMAMDIGIDVQRLDHDEFDHFYEVTLNITASGKREDRTMFIAEVSYGGAISIHGIEEKFHHPLLFVDVPQLLFPYVRHTLANASLSGGFMPLQLTPVNFRAMYLQRFGKNNQTDGQETNEAPAEQAETA